MAQTMTEKIFSEHAGKEVHAGEIVRVEIDMIIGNDITTPISIRAFEESGAEKMARPDNFCIVMDHYIPAKDIASANQAKISREFAYKHDMKYFFDEKDMGIEHALLPEKGLVLPGDVIIGADSHTCTHGALGAFSTGMGSTDLSFGMITGGNWFKVPETIKVELTGKPGEHIYGKDIIFSEGFRSDLYTYFGDEPLRSEQEAIVEGDFMTKNEEEIRSTGYAVYSLEAALWSFYHTDTLEEAILKSVNLGDDADTVAAITGQLAGAYCGIDGIPKKWLSGLSKVKDIGLTIEKRIKYRSFVRHLSKH
jgi:hypothetical protein